jgi:uncharacterized protein YggE
MKPILLLLVLLFSVAVRAQNIEGGKYIEVTGTSEREITPDRIDLLVTIRESEHVKKENELLQKEKQVLAAAARFNVPPADIAVDQIAAHRNGYYKTNSNRYQFSKAYRIALKDIARLDSLIMRLLDAGADQVRITKLSHREMEKYKTEGVAEAIANARRRAEEIARSLGLALGKAVQVKETDPRPAQPVELYDPYLYARQMTMAEASGEGPTIRTIQLKYGVSIKFEVQ